MPHLPAAPRPAATGRLAWRWPALLVATALALGAPGARIAPPPGRGPSGPAAPVLHAGPPLIGAQVHGTWTTWTDADVTAVLRLLAAAGVDLVRVDLGWESVEPRPGVVDPAAVARFDRVVRGARALGLQVLGTLWATPGWANGGNGPNVAPDDPRAYGRIAGEVARHWRGQVAAWELWNEPNQERFLHNRHPPTYVSLLAEAAPAVRAADPAALIVFAGPAYNDVDWISQAYAAGAAGLFDVLGLHPYPQPADAPPAASPPPGADPGAGFAGITAARALLAEQGDGGMPIWLTEFGWSAHPSRPNAPGWERGVTPQQQATYLLEALRLLGARHPDVEVAVWYTARDTDSGHAHEDGYGLLTHDLRPKPAYLALRAAAAGAQGRPGPSVSPSPSG